MTEIKALTVFVHDKEITIRRWWYIERVQYDEYDEDPDSIRFLCPECGFCHEIYTFACPSL